MQSGQVIEHSGVGTGARLCSLHDREPLFLEEDFLELFGRSDVELVSRELEDLV